MVSWPCPCPPLPCFWEVEGGRQTHSPTLCPSDKHTIRFIPHENGVHSIDVKFNGAHIPGSPFKIRVGEQSQAGDPGLVSAYGPGLEGGTTGECWGWGGVNSGLLSLQSCTALPRGRGGAHESSQRPAPGSLGPGPSQL